jgi:hypothetical protein
MFLDEISIQTSIAIYAGLGFIFFLGFGYYFFRNPINKSHSVSWKILLGSIRGLILASLLVAILPFKIFTSVNFNEPVENIFVVDFPDSLTKDFDRTFRKVDSVLKIKYPEFIWVDFNGHEIVDLKRTTPFSRSLSRLSQTIRKLSKGQSPKEVFILTDGNLNDLNIELIGNIHLIPFGQVLNKEQIEFSTTNLPILSVPGEEVHLPVDVWVKNFKRNRNVLINIEVDGAFYKTQKVSFDTDHTYLLTDIDFKSNKLGGHKINVSLDNGVNKWIDWNVVNEKAIVYGFSDALDPDVGVLNRVAKNKFIKLIWNFDITAKIPDKADKFIFMRILPKDIYKSKMDKSSVLFINTSKDKTSLYFKSDHHAKMDGESLWDLQMKEFQTSGVYVKTDSTLGVLFDNLFVNNALDSLNKDRALVDDLLIQDLSNNSLGRNEPKLNFLANKKEIDLLEINDLATADFTQKKQNLNVKQESVFVWQSIYFKLWLLVLILTEWLIRKFRELR